MRLAKRPNAAWLPVIALNSPLFDQALAASFSQGAPSYFLLAIYFSSMSALGH